MLVRVKFTPNDSQQWPHHMSINTIEEDEIISRWPTCNWNEEELLSIAVAIFEYVIPIMHQKELDKIPF
jgi:hypothetical protein